MYEDTVSYLTDLMLFKEVTYTDITVSDST